MTEPTQAGFVVLIDPEYGSDQDPPIEALLGGWLVQPDGERGAFQPNPVYRPRRPDSPLDPVDALLRLLADGEDVAEMLPSVLCDIAVGIAVDEQGIALVRPAPDGVPAVLVATSYGHRARVADVPGWADVTVPQLAEALPERGVDVLLNPGAPASMRVLADAVRAAVARQEPEL